MGVKFDTQNILGRVEQILAEKNIKTAREGDILGFPAKDLKGNQLLVYATISENKEWLFIYTITGKLDDIEEKNRYTALLEILQMNYMLTGAKIAFSEKNEILIMGDTNDTDLLYEEIAGVINAVIAGTAAIRDLLEKY